MFFSFSYKYIATYSCNQLHSSMDSSNDIFCYEVLDEVEKLVVNEMDSLNREMLEEVYLRDLVLIEKSMGEEHKEMQKTESRWTRTKALQKKHTGRFQRWLKKATISWDLRRNEIDSKYVESSKVKFPGPFHCSFMFCKVTSRNGTVSVVCRECLQAKVEDIQNLEVSDSCIAMTKWKKGSAKIVLDAFKFCEWCSDLMLYNKTSIASFTD